MGSNIIEAFEMVFERSLKLQNQIGKYESGADEVSLLKKALKAAEDRASAGRISESEIGKSLSALSSAARDVVNCKEGALLELKVILEKHGSQDIPF